MQILLVDDEPHILRIMRLSLEKEGFSVDTAPNGAVALEKVLQSPPDVLITDIQMPLMTGEELCQALEERLAERRFLIVLLTSRTEVEHRTWSSRLDNLWFFEKPVSMRKLISQLNRYGLALTGAAEGASRDHDRL